MRRGRDTQVSDQLPSLFFFFFLRGVRSITLAIGAEIEIDLNPNSTKLTERDQKINFAMEPQNHKSQNLSLKTKNLSPEKVPLLNNMASSSVSPTIETEENQ